MTIDNFDLLKNIIKPESEDDFWFGQIICRRKDIPDLPRTDKLIKSYYINNLEYSESKKEEIMQLCNLFHGRFYLNPNPRSYKGINLEMVSAAVKNIQNNSERTIIKKLESICGYHNIPGREKIWIIDVDNKSIKEDWVINQFNSIMPFAGTKNKYIATFPTLHGYHILCTPFDRINFNHLIETVKNDITVQTNSPTLIYFNEDI